MSSVVSLVRFACLANLRASCIVAGPQSHSTPACMRYEQQSNLPRLMALTSCCDYCLDCGKPDSTAVLLLTVGDTAEQSDEGAATLCVPISETQGHNPDHGAGQAPLLLWPCAC